ncbi:hypothetical protein GCM10027290_07940 [Micromonospora sonneratiae]
MDDGQPDQFQRDDEEDRQRDADQPEPSKPDHTASILTPAEQTEGSEQIEGRRTEQGLAARSALGCNANTGPLPTRPRTTGWPIRDKGTGCSAALRNKASAP